MTKKGLIISMFMLFSLTVTIAQPRGGMGKGMTMAKNGKIKGKVVDSNTNQPMEYANVAVYSLRDSKLVDGGITDAKGNFEITNLSYGMYKLEVDFIGFKKKEIKPIKILPDNSVINVKEIILSPSSESLEAVNVVAEKARVEYKIDKKIVNVSQDLNAIGGTAVNALENTPSVQVDIEGNVTLRGSGNFTVLIDGKPSVLSGSDALEQIPASTIDNIEIITNPSAKYDPEGVAGIINVVLKKNILAGFNGILNLSAATGDRYRSDLTLNYKTKKYNLFFGVDWSDRNYLGSMESNRKTFNGDTTLIYNNEGDRNFARSGYSFKPGVDLYLNDRSTLTVFGEFGQFNRNSESDGITHRYTQPGSYDLLFNELNESNSKSDYYSGNISFQQKFDDNGRHKLDVMLSYSNRNGDNEEFQEELLKKSGNVEVNKISNKTKSDEKGDSHRLDMQIDYVLPLKGEAKFEAGFKGKINRDDNDFLFSDFDVNTNQWVLNQDFSSDLKFERDVYALYSTYSNKWKALGYMFGVRAEQTHRNIDHQVSNKPSKIDRFDFFPTMHFSYDITQRDQIMASYSRRISRPRGRNLDPTPFYMNQYNIRIGNPDLEPEYTDSYELGIIKRFGRNMVSLEGFYKTTDNLITRVQELKEGETFIHSYENLNRDHSIGLDLMANFNLTKWLMLNVSGSLYNYRLDGSLYGESIDKESTNYNGRINSIFKFSNNSRLQLMGFYRGPSVTAQGEISDFFMTNISYRHDFFQKKLSITASVQDVFQSMNFENESKGPGFESYFRMERESPVFQITLSYKINNYKMDRSSRDGMDGEGGDEDMDMGF